MLTVKKPRLVIFLDEEDTVSKTLLSLYLKSEFDIEVMSYHDIFKRSNVDLSADCYYFHHVRLYNQGTGYQAFRLLKSKHQKVFASVLTPIKKEDHVFDFVHYKELSTTLSLFSVIHNN
jgi:hypothetical protein